jgi:hypothetical protein
MKKANGTPGECPDELGNIGAVKFGISAHHERHENMLGEDGVRCNQYKKGVDGYT